jgi:hypothetical protein
MRFGLAALLAPLFTACIAFAGAPTMTIHEWGTFTNLQDEAGKSIGGINSDDEPLPAFTHNLKWEWSVGDASEQRVRSPFVKGFPRAHPDVTLRLETPVLYFHPSTPGWASPVDVHVEFHGGFLTQFYPDASAGKVEGHITANTTGRLDWTGLTIGGQHPGPQTDFRVWTAPRQVAAAEVTTPKHESERYLFYRGVGHIDAPIRLVRNNGMLQLHGQLDPAFGPSKQLRIPRLWFCEFREDGTAAFREVTPLSVSSEAKPILANIDPNFSKSDFASDRLATLKGQMRAALIKQGLFGDEADALLNTWELSYFKSSGVRLFYIVPREWTEHYLPLRTVPTFAISRAMVGRIDLVTPEQRELLRDMSNHPSAAANDPAVWHDYVLLGRFRNALVLDELKHHPTDGLQAFIRVHALEPG